MNFKIYNRDVHTEKVPKHLALRKVPEGIELCLVDLTGFLVAKLFKVQDNGEVHSYVLVNEDVRNLFVVDSCGRIKVTPFYGEEA